MAAALGGDTQMTSAMGLAEVQTETLPSFGRKPIPARPSSAASRSRFYRRSNAKSAGIDSNTNLNMSFMIHKYPVVFVIYQSIRADSYVIMQIEIIF